MIKNLFSSKTKIANPFSNLKFFGFFIIAFLTSIGSKGQTTQTFSYTGSNQTFVVPAGITSINVKIWGAGGAGNSGGPSSGGSGAFVKGTLAVTAGQSLVFVVGGTGAYGSASAGGFGGGGKAGTGTGAASGGGYSGIFLTSVAQANTLAIAGGGGAGGYYGSSTYGGAGGATTGTNGGDRTITTFQGGRGATVSAGGAAGAGSVVGTAGTALTAGNGASSTYGGGGGGGGYYGGGGGYGSTSTSNYSSGGGGGSSFLGTMTATTNTVGVNSNGTTTTATQAPGNSETGYVTGVGNGGSSTTTSGGNGLIVITYTLPACTTPTVQPTALTFGTTSATSIAGSFTAASPAPSGYMVVRSTSATPPTPVNGTAYAAASTALGAGTYVVQNGTATSFTDATLTSNTKYYYYIFSYNDNCTGTPYYLATSPLSGNKTTCAAVPTVATTPVTSITSSSATINWVASAAGGSAGTINYTVEVYTDSGYTTSISGSPFNAGTSTSKPITFTNAATTYYYRIKANNGSCDSTYLTGSFIPSCAAPTALAASATVSASGITSISGSFTATSATPVPTGYVVIRSTSNSLPVLSAGTTYTVGTNTSIATNGYVEYVGTTAGSWTSTGLSGGQTYYYFVFSYNNTSCSSGPLYSATATQNNATTSGCPTFSSVISIGGSTTTPGSLYPSLTAAITDLSACSIAQPTTLSLNSSYASASETFPIVIPNIAGSSNFNTLTIKPASGVTATISGSAASNPIIKINGGSNVIIDGSNTVGGTTKDLSLTNTSTTAPNVVVIGSPNTAPVTNVIFKNTVVTNGVNTASAVIVSSSATIGSAGYFNNITIQNNSFRKAYIGLFVVGNTATNNGNGLVITGNDFSASGTNSMRQIGIYVEGVDGTSVISNNVIGTMSNANAGEYPTGIWLSTGTNKANIYGNTISSIISTYSGDASAVGIYILSGSTASAINVYNNTISGISSYGYYVDGTTGIEVGSSTANVNINANKISTIKNNNTSGYGASGIFLGSTSTTANTSLFNNMIWDVAGYGSTTISRNGHGLYAYSGAGYKIYYNSINLTTNQTAGIGAALYVDSAITTANALDVRNNIFANNQTTNTRYAIYSGAAKTVFSNIDYNDYYSTSTATLGYLGGTLANLAAFQATTGTGQDTHSLNSLPPFTSATNLSIPASSCTTLESAGTPISGITKDIDDETRSATTPDIGADEFAGNILPKVASVTNGSNCGTGQVALGVTGSSTGAAITEYRLYTASTGGTPVATSTTGTLTTPSISSTTNYYVAVYNGCESETRTLITATINPAPTVVDITNTNSSICSGTIQTVTATGGVMPISIFTETANVLPTSFTLNNTTGTGAVSLNTTYYSEGTGSVLFKNSSTTTALDVQYAMNSNLDLTGSSSAQLTFSHIAALEGKTTTFDVGYVQYSTNGGSAWTTFPSTSYTGSGSLITDINGTAVSGTVFSTKSYSDWVSNLTTSTDTPTNSLWKTETINIPSAALTSTQFRIRFRYTSDSSVFYYGWLLDNIKVTKSNNAIQWSADTGAIYTDLACTSAYNGTDYLTTVYVKPTATVEVTAKAQQGSCPVSDKVKYTVKTSVAITSATSAASAICTTATTTLTANGVAGDGSVVTWYTGSGATGTNLGTGATLNNVGPGTYYAYVTGDCGAPVEKSVTVNAKTPVAITSATSAASAICATSTTILTANGVVGDGAVVRWYTGSGGTGTNLGTGTTLNNVGPGTYYAYVTGDCGSPVEKTITVTAKAIVAITSATSAASAICTTATTTLTANGVAGDGAVVTWYTGSGATGTNLGTGMTLNNVGPGTYYAYVTGDCGTPVEKVVTVTAKIPVAITSATSAANAICSTATTTLTANGVAGDGAVVTWYTGSGATGTNLGIGTTLNNVGPGTYYAYVTGDCGTPIEKVVIIDNGYQPNNTSADWYVAADWKTGSVPDNTKCVVIPNGTTVVINNTSLQAMAKSLTIASAGKAIIKANSSLTVTDAINITNNAGNDNLTLESDAVLLQENAVANSGNMLAKRTAHMRKMDYTYWSTPVTGQKLLDASGDGFSVGTPNNRIYYYYEPNDTFKAVPATETSFVNAKGYAIRGKDSYLITDPTNAPVSDEFKFVGVPNNGSYSINIQRSANTGTGGTVEHGYNMIGNPYPSNIDFVKFYYLGNNSNVINAKAWFWSDVTPVINQAGSAYSGNNYATITLSGGTPPTYSDTTVTPNPTSGSYIPTKNIKVGQGFIVQSKSVGTNQTLNFNNTIRTNESGIFFNNKENGASDVNRYWVKLTTPDKIVNTILLAHIDGATNNYDANYDADLLSVGDDSFYSKLNTQKLQIQARHNPVSSEDIIPLGAKYSANGTYKISLGDKQGIFSTNQKIYLVDKLNNIYTDLTTQDYSFAASKGTDETRFQIVYKSNEVLATDDLKKSDFVVYRDGEVFVIKSSYNLGKIEVYDASGKMVSARSTSQKEFRWDASTIPSGVYIIRAENSGNIRTKKIIK